MIIKQLRAERKIKNNERRAQWIEKAKKYEAEYAAAALEEVTKNREVLSFFAFNIILFE